MTLFNGMKYLAKLLKFSIPFDGATISMGGENKTCDYARK